MIPSQMLKGVLQGSVLAILGQRETYGYEIVQALHGYGFGSVSEGTIYPLLLRLEKEGWVSARFMDSDLGPRRKYYTLTDQGRRELAVPGQFPGDDGGSGAAAGIWRGGDDMRKSSVRTLRQENNARERALSRESQREMTDVVVYLRGQDLSPLDQEEIRRDILDMVWEAEARGETMAQVVGQDYRTFCQAIVAAVPRRSRRVRMAAAVEELLPALSVLLGIWLVKKVVEALLRGEAVMHLTLTLGEAISMGVLLAASVGIVTYLCRTALEGERGRSRGKGFFMAWAFCVALLAAIFLPTFLLTNPLLTLWLPVAVAVVILPLLVHGVLARWMER